MARTSSLTVAQLQSLLGDLFADYMLPDGCPNGLQVAGSELASDAVVRRVATGVTASQTFLEQATKWDADACLVHHGLFWKGDSPVVAGMLRKRLAVLMENDVWLFAYHLPLDVLPERGNNAMLGLVLGADRLQAHDDGLMWTGELTPPRSAEEISDLLKEKLDQVPVHVAPTEVAGADIQPSIQRIAWCTGAGQKFIHRADELGAQAYISGEISEQTTHSARELGLHYFAAGHHATERFGVQQVGKWLHEKTGVEVRFIDDPNPA